MAATVAPAMSPERVEVWLHEHYPVGDLRALIALITKEKRTGSLTLHFTEGRLGAIALDWKQREKAKLSPPM